MIEASAKINLTPMIDVVMCLIIFFLIVGSLASAKLEPVDLPSSARGEARLGEPVIVNITQTDEGGSGVRATVMGEAVTPITLGERFGGAGTVVRFRVDRRVEYRFVRDFARACRASGVERIEFSTRPTGVTP